MSVPSGQRPLTFHSVGGNPDVVLRDGRARFGELCPDMSIVCRCGDDGSQQGHSRARKFWDFAEISLRVLRKVRAAVEFAHNGQRLHLEDSTQDVEIIHDLLLTEFPQLRLTRVDNAADFRAALERVGLT